MNHIQLLGHVYIKLNGFLRGDPIKNSFASRDKIRYKPYYVLLSSWWRWLVSSSSAVAYYSKYFRYQEVEFFS